MDFEITLAANIQVPFFLAPTEVSSIFLLANFDMSK